MKKLIVFLVCLMLVLNSISVFAAVSEENDESSVVESYVNGQIIVKFMDGTHPSDKRNIRAKYNLETKKEFEMGAELAYIKGNVSMETLLRVLNNNPFIDYAQPDYIIQRPESVIEPELITDYGPSDYADELWGLENVNVEEAWDTLEASGSQLGAPEVMVAVIDTGIQTDHPDLADNIWKNQAEINGLANVDDDGNGFVDDYEGWDFINNDNSLFDDRIGSRTYYDDHGTHVAGTIAATANSSGVVGIAPNVTILPLKFIGKRGGSTSDAIAAIQYAQQEGARIINASWGHNWSEDPYGPALKEAIDYFGTNYSGIFVAAAGNGGSDGLGDNNDVYPHYPSSFTSENLISVASTDFNRELSYFSNYGLNSVDLAAPGGIVYAGETLESGISYSRDMYILSTYPYNSYAYMAGTSMATPHVTGVLALMVSYETQLKNTDVWDGTKMLSAVELKNKLLNSVSDYGGLGNYLLSGGELNAYQAVSSALDQMPASAWTSDYGNDPVISEPIPAEVVAVAPENGALVSSETVVTFSFDKTVTVYDPTKLMMVYLDENGNPIDGGAIAFSSEVNGVTVTLTPESLLEESATVKVSLEAGAVTTGEFYTTGDPVLNTEAAATIFDIEAGVIPPEPAEYLSLVSSIPDQDGNMSKNGNILLTFDTEIQMIDASLIELSGPSGDQIPITVSNSGAVLTVDPDIRLDKGTHTLIIKMGAVKSAVGELALAADYVLTFTAK